MIDIDLNHFPVPEGDSDSDYESLDGEDLEDLCGGIENLAREEVHVDEEEEDLEQRVFVSKPVIGQEFESSAAFDVYMRSYAYANGFSVRNNGRDKLPKSIKNTVPENTEKTLPHKDAYKRIRMVCVCQGFAKSSGKNPSKQSKSMKCGCKMGATANRQSAGHWKVTGVDLEHNHPIAADETRFTYRYRGISDADESTMLMQQRAGIRPSQIYSMFVLKYNGIEKVPFSEKDMRNLLNRKAVLQLENGDYLAMEQLFEKMQEKSSNFFYCADVHESTGRVRNIFWADGRSRKAYADFGDVISFDTTYLSNRYKMPFAPFIGVNQHGQSILFGCALIAKDDAENFTWLFKMWLKCMGGKAPKCILTDQCRSIAKAVAEVFPSTQHRWCLWHILRNMRKHFGAMTEWADIAKSVRRILHESLSVEEFEAEWAEWCDKYQMAGKTWIVDMYKDRHRWVPVYFKDNFWAGMSSTQRSEGMNNFFKGFVNVNTTLQVFVQQYAMALSKRVENEAKETHESIHKPFKCLTEFGFEQVFQSLYTNAKFSEFQKQVSDMMYCNATVIQVNEVVVVYEVKSTKVRKGRTRRRTFLVTVRRKPLWDIRCDCKNFEFRGIVCCHMLQAFKVEERQQVPQRLIVDRWRKDLCREYTKEDVGYGDLLRRVPLAKTRYDVMELKFQKLASRAMMNEGTYKKVIEILTKLEAEFRPGDNLPPGLGRDEQGNVVKTWGSNKRPTEQAGPSGTSEGRPLDPVDKRKRGRAQTHRSGYAADKAMERNAKKKKKKNKKGGMNNEDRGDEGFDYS